MKRQAPVSLRNIKSSLTCYCSAIVLIRWICLEQKHVWIVLSLNKCPWFYQKDISFCVFVTWKGLKWRLRGETKKIKEKERTRIKFSELSIVVNWPRRKKRNSSWHCNHLWRKTSIRFCGKGRDIQLLGDNYGLLQLFIFIVLVIIFIGYDSIALTKILRKIFSNVWLERSDDPTGYKRE